MSRIGDVHLARFCEHVPADKERVKLWPGGEAHWCRACEAIVVKSPVDGRLVVQEPGAAAFGFEVALRMLRDGWRVRRKTWDASHYVSLSPVSTGCDVFDSNGIKMIAVRWDDVLHPDWVLAP